MCGRRWEERREREAAEREAWEDDGEWDDEKQVAQPRSRERTPARWTSRPPVQITVQMEPGLRLNEVSYRPMDIEAFSFVMPVPAGVDFDFIKKEVREQVWRLSASSSSCWTQLNRMMCCINGEFIDRRVTIPAQTFEIKCHVSLRDEDYADGRSDQTLEELGEALRIWRERRER
jgi:hypothetical protein